MRDKQQCGCVHDGERWLTFCATHQAAQDAHASREAANHIARATSDFSPTAEYAALAAQSRAWLED
jgi:hypothetical protein